MGSRIKPSAVLAKPLEGHGAGCYLRNKYLYVPRTLPRICSQSQRQDISHIDTFKYMSMYGHALCLQNLLCDSPGIPSKRLTCDLPYLIAA